MRYWLIGVSVIVGLVGGIGSQAAEDWRITSFNSDVTIAADGAVQVTETINVDFGAEAKHGIYRDMPYMYSGVDGASVYTRLDNIGVRQDGAPATTKIEKNSANIRIRIGDAKRTITGLHSYQISYQVQGALRSFDGYDELYWNVTGHEWPVPIDQAIATVRLPPRIQQVECYQGASGTVTKCDVGEVRGDAAHFATKALDAGSGLTIAVGYQPGIIPILSVDPPLTLAQVLSSSVTWAVGVGVALVSLALLIYRWWHYGRDRFWQRAQLPGERSDRSTAVPERVLPLWRRTTVSPEYDPPDNLRPAEIGVLMDEQAHTLDISATIVDLAARGYLIITEVPKKWLFGSEDYVLARTAKDAAGLMQYEKLLLERLFAPGTPIALSSLKNTFYDDLALVKNALYEEAVMKKLFPQHPEKVRGRYQILAVVLLAAAVLAVSGTVWLLMQTTWRAGWYMIIVGIGLGSGVSGLGWFVASFVMPRKTAYGRELYERTRGYQLFIGSTEKYRAKFLEREHLFLDILSYAIIFGLTTQLVRSFAKMGITPPVPGWYVGSRPFNMVHFAGSLNNFSNSLSSAIAATPRSSGSGGSGFSGGGFGGGGGGSW